ncbi:hypothetical protein HYFRA_00003253 [Hymenoscyphus fraxineus]|uniref:Cytochrome b-c1 complex subunit 8 n=1 Tax=Hymenoscyphus fraxineus TaxID=746836 RepID=A0A9N9PHG8_9HELO|nr:hypothetical protein HYFRA_00003253 [Hymenoscyphus fraxineus]
MRPSQMLRSGGSSPIGKYGKYLGEWGNLEEYERSEEGRLEEDYGAVMDSMGRSQPQRGVITYALSNNAQRPLAGTLNAAIFNTFRRFSGQVFYFAPPMIVGYFAMSWAIERNEYLNSKAGIAEFGEDE